MRIKHRWLLLGVFIVAAVVIVAVLGSRRTVHAPVTVTFLGYTNLLGATVRSAVFDVHTERSGFFSISLPALEIERLDFYGYGWSSFSRRPPIGRRSGSGYSWLFLVDEPSVNGRWRASWGFRHYGLRWRLIEYALRHRLLPKPWLDSLVNHEIAYDPKKAATISSPWLTNSP